jgi:Tfp pilus assembly protein PilN
MKAVNLIPAEERRGAGGAAGRAGGAVYVLLGGLVVLVLMSVLYAVSSHQAKDRQSKLTQVNTQAGIVQSQATALQPYVTFATIRQTREQAIGSLASSRFDWAAAMDQIARSLPGDVTLSAMTGTSPASTPAAPTAPTAPTATTSTTTPATVTNSAPPTAATTSGPSVALTGCAKSHSEVATVLVALHEIVGVNSVSLASSQKPSGQGAAGSTAACPGATFAATLVYAPNSATVATTTNTNGVTATTATSPTAGSIR